MDLEKLLSKQEQCINDNPPSCITECPIHVNVKGLIEEIQKGNFEEAYKILKKRVPLINIITRICDHPCESACITYNEGKEISIHELEKATVLFGSKAKITTLPIPKSDKKIAVIGGGISGLICAFDLNQKGYQVTIFDKSSQLGGSLLKIPDHILEQKVVKEEIDNIEESGIEIKLNQNITCGKLMELTKEYNAVFLATGVWEEELNYNNVTLQTKNEKIFVGGRIVIGCNSVIQSVYTGRCAAVSIDRFVHNKSLTALREKEGTYESSLKMDVDHKKIPQKVLPESGNYSKEEAIKEANRCVQCECHKCVKACIHMQKEKLDQKSYIRTINQNERIILGDHYANKTINSCTECGLCGAVCQSSLNMADIIKETRASMVAKEKMPLSAHDYALKDMDSSNSEYFELVKHQSGKDQSKYVFYPGCQLSASYPDYVLKTYLYLADNLEGGVGLYLGCCGAPAEWAGREELYRQTIEKTRLNLEALGNPVIITACSTCFRNFNNSFKNLKIKTLWEIFNEKGIPEDAISGNGKVLAVHDACTTRDNKQIHESIRKIAQKLNYKIEEPEFTKETTKCCGYGGLVYYANKEFSKEVTEDRIKDSDKDFLTYCANCRDLFLLRGKPTYHILDLIFGNGKAKPDIKVPNLSERRSNRWRLKKNMLRCLWGEEMDIKDEYDELKIDLSNDLLDKMEEELILEGDIKKVIGYSLDTKNSFYNPENNHVLASRRLNNVTFWVEYEKIGDSFRIFNTYSHRMKVSGV